MSAVVVSIPATAWRRYSKAREAVLLRASAIGASDRARGHALHVLLHNLRTGASPACAISLANGSLRRSLEPAQPAGGAA